jgi:hypothetical protein
VTNRSQRNVDARQLIRASVFLRRRNQKVTALSGTPTQQKNVYCRFTLCKPRLLRSGTQVHCLRFRQERKQLLEDQADRCSVILAIKRDLNALPPQNIESSSCQRFRFSSLKNIFIGSLVSWNKSSLHMSDVILGKLAIASATRNPGVSNTSGYRPSPV